MSWNEKETLSIVRSEVAGIMIMNPQDLGNSTLLVEYGLDSIQAMDIVLAMEERFRIEIGESEMHDIGTIADIVTLVRGKFEFRKSL